MSMTDPTHALTSFQHMFSAGLLNLQRGALDRDLYVTLDHPNGIARFTYAHAEGSTVTALAILATSSPVDLLPCFAAGYAVPSAYRNQGRARRLLVSALSELQYGLARANISQFYVEAVVGKNNLASQRVAEEVISSHPKSVTDSVSGLPALQYLRKFG